LYYLISTSLRANIPDAVDDGVVDGVGLGEERGPDGGQRADGGTVEDAGVVDDQVGSPRHEPQGDGHQGNLSTKKTIRKLEKSRGSEVLRFLSQLLNNKENC